MIQEKINKILNDGSCRNIPIFNDMLLSKHLRKRYSIVKGDPCYPIGNNLYRTNFCFFFYAKDYLIATFYCEVKGEGIELKNEKIDFYRFPCNDVNRADCWKWVDVA